MSSAPTEMAGNRVPELDRAVPLSRTRRPRRPLVVLALGAAFVMILLAAVGPSVLVSPNGQDLTHALQPPFWMHGGNVHHLLGTDLLGRDLLSRAVGGLQVSLIAALAALALGAVVGVGVGMTAGYVGGLFDEVVMRVVDIQLAVPGIVFVMLIVAILKPTLLTIIGVLALIAWVVFARVARAQVLSLREQEMVVAIRTMGASHARILLRHVLPNIAGPLLVIATVELANLVIVQAALSYLGLGVPPPAPTLGGMIAEGQTELAAQIWWPVVVPGCFIVVVIAAANVIGDWLRDLLDPRARTR